MENINTLLTNKNDTDRNASMACLLLKARARQDSCLADHIVKSEKMFSDCWKYVRQKARKLSISGCACVSENDVLTWMVHFYLEDGKPEDMKTEKPSAVVKSVKTESQKVSKAEEKEKLIDDIADHELIHAKVEIIEKGTGVTGWIADRFARIAAYLDKAGLKLSDDEICDWVRHSVLEEGTYDYLKKLIDSHSASLAEPAEKTLANACICWTGNFGGTILSASTKLDADKKTRKAVIAHDQLTLF